MSGYGRYIKEQDRFMDVPGCCVAYAASDSLLVAFTNGKRIDSFVDAKQGLATADNNRFLRLWFEVSVDRVSFSCSSHEEAAINNMKWFPYNKGGGFCKWYGNNEYLINWMNDGRELTAFKKSIIRSPHYYFRECLSWCKVTISGFYMRFIPTGFLFDVAGCSLFVPKEKIKYVLGFANSKVNSTILAIITIARICTDYVHEQQARYRTAIQEIEKRIETVSQSDKVKLTKKLNTLKDQDEEIHAYEEKIHHLADQMISIDLDDGVKHNYALFQDVLAKIK